MQCHEWRHWKWLRAIAREAGFAFISALLICVRRALIAYVYLSSTIKEFHIWCCGDFINRIILLWRRDSERLTAWGPCVSVNDINPNEWNVPLAVHHWYGSLTSVAVHLQLEYEKHNVWARVTHTRTWKEFRVFINVLRHFFAVDGFRMVFFFSSLSRAPLCRSLMLSVFVVSFPTLMCLVFFFFCCVSPLFFVVAGWWCCV